MRERLRAEGTLPPSLLPVHDVGDGAVICLDTERTGRDGEAPAIHFWPGWDPVEQQPYPVFASDFGTLLLYLVGLEISYIEEDAREAVDKQQRSPRRSLRSVILRR